MKKTIAFIAVFSLAVVTAGGGQGGQENPGAGRGLIAGTGVWMFPHLFHFDETNTSSLIVTNNSTDITVEVSINLRNRDGVEVGNDLRDLTHFDLAPKATARFDLAALGDGEFVGTASLYCKSYSCLAVANWEFDFGEGRRYSVGMPGISTFSPETHWATSASDPTGQFAVAVFNHINTDNPCTLDHFDPSGQTKWSAGRNSCWTGTLSGRSLPTFPKGLRGVLS